MLWDIDKNTITDIHRGDYLQKVVLLSDIKFAILNSSILNIYNMHNILLKTIDLGFKGYCHRVEGDFLITFNNDKIIIFNFETLTVDYNFNTHHNEIHILPGDKICISFFGRDIQIWGKNGYEYTLKETYNYKFINQNGKLIFHKNRSSFVTIW